MHVSSGRVASIAAAAFTLCGAAPPPLELDAVLEEVRRSSPDVRAEAASVEVARAAVDVAGAWEDPTIGVMAQGIPLTAMDPADDQLMFRYRVSLPLNVLFGRRRLAKDAATARAVAQTAGLRRTTWDAQAEAVGLFLELWQNGEERRLLGAQVRTLRRTKQAALARYRAGMSKGHHEVLRATGEIEVMHADKAALEPERIALVARLNLLRGRPQGEEVGHPTLAPRAPLISLATLLARVRERPELAALRAMRREATARRDLARREYAPMLMVEAEYMQRIGMPDGVGVGVVFSVPLFWWDRQRGEVDMAEAMRTRADRRLEAMAAMTDADVRMAWSRAIAADKRLTALESAAIPAMVRTVKSSRSDYISGRSDFLSVLESVQKVLALRLTRSRAVVARETARFELARLLGAPLGEVAP